MTFDNLKHLLMFAHPELALDTDGSKKDIGAVLPQVIDGKESAYAYASCCLSRSE